MGNVKKKNWTLAEHKTAGKSLKIIVNNLLDLHVDLAKVYGKSHKAANLANKAHKAVDALRCELDNVLARETSDGEWKTKRLEKTYYGH